MNSFEVYKRLRMEQEGFEEVKSVQMREFPVESIQNVVRVVVAALLGVWQGLPQVTQVLVWLMLLDVVLGVTVSLRDGNYRMDEARRGAYRKVGFVAQLVVAAIMNPYVGDVLGVDLVQAVSAFYVIPELASVTRHTTALGVPVFPQLQQILDRLPRGQKNAG